jgi:nucleoside-diphosphate-sugar epimerase
MKSILTTAAANPSVKRVVFCSSIVTATPLKRNGTEPFYVDETMWNGDAVTQAWKPPPYPPSRAGDVYTAAKLESERAVLNFVKDNRVGFTVAAVLPGTIMGQVLHPQQRASTGGLIKGLWANDAQAAEMMKHFTPNLFINVEDLALLHVGAVLDPELVNERLLAYFRPYNFNDVIEEMHKIDSQRGLPAKMDDPGQTLDTEVRLRSLEVIRRMGRDGFKPFDQTIAENIGPFAEF